MDKVPLDGKIAVAGKRRSVGERDVLRLAPDVGTYREYKPYGGGRGNAMQTLLPLFLAAAACSSPTAPPSVATPPPQSTASAATVPPAAPATRCPEPKAAAALPDWQGSPLQRAILDRDLTRVRALATGPALEEADNYHDTPLLTALRPIVREPAAPRPSAAARQAELEAQLEILRELLDRGANPNQKGPDGTTAPHQAAQTAYGDEHALRLLALLVGATADLDARDNRGATALMEAARARRAAVAQFLVDRGADTSQKDCTGQTALDIARAVDAPAVATVLAPIK